MAPQSQFKYHIVNAQSGTVLDLSGTNQTTISCWENNGGDNQQWYIEHVDPAIGLITIKNVRYGKFVSFTGAMPPMHSEVPAVGAKESRLPWKIEELGQGLCRILVPRLTFVLELTKDGDKANGTPVVITLAKPDVEAQQWRFVEVKGA